jgi:4-carboxymuconolactone decarboxylase
VSLRSHRVVSLFESQLFAEGLAVRRDVLGPEYVDEKLASSTEFNSPLQELVTEYCWGTVWTRPGLDMRTRSLINLGMLVALRQWSELSLHVRGALRNGCTVGEIQEALLQTVVYCGVPAGVEAFKIASSVVKQVAVTETEGVSAPTGP